MIEKRIFIKLQLCECDLLLNKEKNASKEDHNFLCRLKILKEIDKVLNKRGVAKIFGIATIIVRESITEHKSGFKWARKRKRTCQCDNLAEAMLKWIIGIRERNLPLSRHPMNLQKTLEYPSSLGISEFQVSVG